MATLKRVGPGSAFKVGLIVYGFIGLIFGAFVSLFSLIGAGIAGGSAAGGFGIFFGTFSILVFPICYGIIGAIFAAISAAIYNLAAGWVGGLQVDIS
ncbi:MAG: hypothetical protein WAM91_18150 [Candidatus Acidiferrales bacterium]